MYLCSFFSLSPSPSYLKINYSLSCAIIYQCIQFWDKRWASHIPSKLTPKKEVRVAQPWRGPTFVNSDAELSSGSFLPQLNLPFQMCLSHLGPSYRVTRFQRCADTNKEFNKAGHFPLYKGEIEVHRGETPCLTAQHSSS